MNKRNLDATYLEKSVLRMMKTPLPRFALYLRRVPTATTTVDAQIRERGGDPSSKEPRVHLSLWMT
jgi:hypothetical protein